MHGLPVHGVPTCVKCPLGHSLVTKKVSGGVLGIGLKHCSDCGTQLTTGQFRYSCKGCGYHLCGSCYSLRAATAAASAPPPPPSLPVGPVAGSLPVCRWGAACTNFEKEHRSRFFHPAVDKSVLDRSQRRACKYGAACYQKSALHLSGFVHPGDRGYREGLVIFASDQQPEFESLWQLFQFHDPDESGHLSKEEFGRSLCSIDALIPGRLPEPREQAWVDVDGPRSGFVSFRQFVTWTQKFLGLDFPLGLEVAGSSRPCRFRIMSADGVRCSCPGFTEDESGSGICVCGHKASMHRSDIAQKTATAFLSEAGVEHHWEPDEEGFVRIRDEQVLARLQQLMVATHKKEDNWTRDRGCTLHGVNGCAHACASKHRVPVPVAYRLVCAYRNQNQDLWQNYQLMTRAMREDSRKAGGPIQRVSVATGGRPLEGEPLDVDRNEWYLWHGSAPENLKGICSSNFRLALAGSGGTWKDAGKAVGTPLYGYGIYLAEHLTKADEYAQRLKDGDELFPEVEGSPELHCAILCRVFGGRARVVETNEFEIEKLRSDVFEGAFDSVFGDRVSKLGKPYREVVVYDKDQCYPEYLLVYQRCYK